MVEDYSDWEIEMADILDVSVGSAWVDVYGITGIAEGSAMEVVVKGLYGVYIMESATTPTNDTAGNPLTNIGGGYATASVLSGSSKIWLRCASGDFSKVAVQERI